MSYNSPFISSIQQSHLGRVFLIKLSSAWYNCFLIFATTGMPTSGKKRGPAPKPVGLVLNVNLVKQNPKTKKIPKITLLDCMYHIAKDTI